MDNRDLEVCINWNYMCYHKFIIFIKLFKKPTAQVYYKRFCKEKAVLMDWKQVRSKVRNLRVSYNKAKSWEGSTGAGSMEGESLKSKVFIIT